MRSLTAILLLALVGCAGKPAPETQLYLLRSDSGNAFGDSDQVAEVGLGSVRVASYIDQPGLALELPDGTMRAARYHQWAEPLRESLRGYLANAIAAKSGQPVRPAAYGQTNWRSYTKQLIDVRVQELHGTGSGAARLVAMWAIIDAAERTLVSEHEFVGEEPLDGSGYPALVAAEERLLNRLAAEIAQAL